MNAIVSKVFSIGKLGSIVFLSIILYRRIVSSYHDTMRFFILIKYMYIVIIYLKNTSKFNLYLNFKDIICLYRG
jgi:hypothetical protein